MKRYLHGLRQATASSSDENVPDGLFLVRVERAQYRWHARKPSYAVVFSMLEPNSVAGVRFNTRLDCSPKALWKLNWFLRDFGYDSELLGRDEIDDALLVGLSGVVKISRAIVNGTTLLNLDAFAPISDWPRLSDGDETDIQVGNTKAAS